MCNEEKRRGSWGTLDDSLPLSDDSGYHDDRTRDNTTTARFHASLPAMYQTTANTNRPIMDRRSSWADIDLSLSGLIMDESNVEPTLESIREETQENNFGPAPLRKSNNNNNKTRSSRRRDTPTSDKADKKKTSRTEELRKKIGRVRHG